MNNEIVRLINTGMTFDSGEYGEEYDEETLKKKAYEDSQFRDLEKYLEVGTPNKLNG